MFIKLSTLNRLPTLIFICLLTAVFQSFVFGQPESYKILTVPQITTSPPRSGGYLPLAKLPPKFSNFDNFTYQVIANKGKLSEVVGAINIYESPTESSHIFQFEELSLSVKTISFKTETFNDIHYEFQGTYLKNKDFVRFNRRKIPVLEGTLTKFVNDKKDVETKLRFYYIVWEAPYYLPPVKESKSN